MIDELTRSPTRSENVFTGVFCFAHDEYHLII